MIIDKIQLNNYESRIDIMLDFLMLCFRNRYNRIRLFES